MSSLTLLESSDTERSQQSESGSSDSVTLRRNYDPNYSKAKLWLASAESKLKVKPLVLRFRPRWAAGGDELCRAAEELDKAGHQLDCLNLVRRAAYCYLRAHLVLRAVKTLELGLSIALDQHRQATISRADLISLAETVQSLHLSLAQPDEAVRALEVVAQHLLQDSQTHPGDGERGLALLNKALNILVTSGRHCRAGSVALTMLTVSYHRHSVTTTDMMQVGKTCLNMFVMTSNVNMAGTALSTLILALIKHSQSNAKAEANILYQDNVGNISKEVRDSLKLILEADWDKLSFDGELESLRSRIKTGETKEILLLSSPQVWVGEEGTSGKMSDRKGLAKSSMVLAGAALPLSVLAFNPRGRGGISQFREVQDQKRDHPGGRATGKAVQAVHADENGYEAFQPQDVGKPNDGNLV